MLHVYVGHVADSIDFWVIRIFVSAGTPFLSLLSESDLKKKKIMISTNGTPSLLLKGLGIGASEQKMKPWIFILILSLQFHNCNGFLPHLSFFSKGSCDRGLKMGGYDSTIGVDPSTPIQFFTLPGNTCPYAQRTHIVLHELEIPVDTTEVTGFPKPDWFLKINPQGKCPTIRVPAMGNQVIVESTICNEFLCDYATNTLGEKQQLMPMDPILRAQIRMINHHCDEVFTKTQFTFLMNKDEEQDTLLAHKMEEALMKFEKSISTHGGPFLLGEYFTLADITLYPFIFRLIITLKHWKNYDLSKDIFPNLLLWFDACTQQESVKKSSVSEKKILEVYAKFMDVNYKFGGLNQNN